MLFLTYFSLSGELVLFELLQKKVLHLLVLHHRLANHNHFVFSLHEALADVESFSYSVITQVKVFYKFEKTKNSLEVQKLQRQPETVLQQVGKKSQHSGKPQSQVPVLDIVPATELVFLI